ALEQPDMLVGECHAVAAVVALRDDQRLLERRPGERGLAGLLVAVGEVEQGAPAGVELVARLELRARLGVFAGLNELPRVVVKHLSRGRVSPRGLRRDHARDRWDE